MPRPEESDAFIVEPWPQGGLHEDMSICPDCLEAMIQQDHIEEDPEGGWLANLHCGACQTDFFGHFTSRQVDHFENVSDANTISIARDISHLETERVDAFVAALATGRILPEDF